MCPAINEDGLEAFELAPWEVDVASDDDWAAAASRALVTNGFCVLRGKCVSEELCERCGEAAVSRLAALLERARARGLDPERGDSSRFSELCQRMHSRRFDVRLPPLHRATHARSIGGLGEDERALWASLQVAADRWAWPVLRASMLLSHEESGIDGRIDSAGAVVALPGAAAQDFHADGSLPGLVNCFVALVPTTPHNGPTEFQPGSHDPVDFAFAPPPWQDEAQVAPVAPCLARGEILLFQYRVKHRGCANASAVPRPVGYLVYAQHGAQDDYNFPTDSSLFDEHDRLESGLG